MELAYDSHLLAGILLTVATLEPTGSAIKVKGINIDRVSGGRIIEHWGEADTVGMLVQMGVDPFAGRAGCGPQSK